MPQFKGDYLRVLSPVTSDGVSPVVVNDRIKYREDHLPVTAKKMLEKKNERLPSGLRKKIEVVSSVVRPEPIKTSKPAAPVQEFEDESENQDFHSGQDNNEPPPPAKNRGGRPRKNA